MHRPVRPSGLSAARLFAASCAVAGAFALAPSPAAAQADHLQCYKIKDALAKAEYTADLTPDDLAFPASAGCTIKTPAKLLCVDAVKSNVSPAPPGADPGAAAQKYLCYKAKCPKAQPTATLEDQFGTHAVEVKGTSLLCAPVPVAGPTCSDATQNGSETDIDCGGGTCPGCAPGDVCAVDSDCASSVCLAGVCQAPSCSDGVSNGSETGIDCGGGGCPACAPGQGCSAASDCTSQVCLGGLCQMPSCSDLVQNGSESDVDCGGTCPGCVDGENCSSGSDCLSGTCQGGQCVTLLGNGSACSFNGECASAQCVDGVCCNSACSGLCQGCTNALTGGMPGVCSIIPAGTDPQDECVGASTCDGMGFCTP